MLETPDGEVRAALQSGVACSRPLGTEHNDFEFVFVEVELK